jgi:hypothetical protein
MDFVLTEVQGEVYKSCWWLSNIFHNARVSLVYEKRGSFFLSDSQPKTVCSASPSKTENKKRGWVLQIMSLFL